MWPVWLRSPTRSPTFSHRKPPSSPPSHPPQSPRHFSCTSFKDIQTLLETPKCGSISEPQSPKTPSVFHRVRIATALLRHHHRHHHHKAPIILSPPPNSDDRQIILYFTSLRIVRKTFEDCRAVRSILRGFRVPIDERDLSMDGRFLDELQTITGAKKVSLPVVFIAGKYVGGADEIREMNESGELKKMISLVPFVENNVCDLCGGLRFIVCEQCNGSHKIFTEKYGFRSCTTCNVDGLIRCPVCFPVYRRRMSSVS
ncbi:Glutaredoxin family protein [Euphorbia peplus]|nr:Glutaredoxin family protein [Euphorbia peplus]